jgi:hypothetical protein
MSRPVAFEEDYIVNSMAMVAAAASAYLALFLSLSYIFRLTPGLQFADLVDNDFMSGKN